MTPFLYNVLTKSITYFGFQIEGTVWSLFELTLATSKSNGTIILNALSINKSLIKNDS